MFGVVFWGPANKGVIDPSADTAIKVATSGGTIIGQLGFGYLADVVGRKRMYGLELIIIIFATLAQALSSPSISVSFVGLIIFWRVLMGVGIGQWLLADSMKCLTNYHQVVTTHCLPSSLPNLLPPNGEAP
jgi:MFS transporter, PHS family, inorganic phosphate transporter